MSVLGVILGIIGLLITILATVTGIIVGIPAAVLGLLAVLLGVLAKKKGKRGLPAIIIGVLAVVLAVVLTISGINSARFHWEQVKAHPEKAPTFAKYADKAKLEYSYLGFLILTSDADEAKLISDEIVALVKGEEPKTPAAADAPAAEQEAPASEQEAPAAKPAG